MLISIEGDSVADFDTQSAFNMLMGMVITFPGNYCVGEGNTINKSISISL
jgi:predicted HAD superfamily phosphohydrolase